MKDIHEIVAEICEAKEEILRQSMNPVADLYRAGADLHSLLPLFTHPDPRVVSIGAWIASEVVDGQRGREIFHELSLLADHPEPEVRFWSIGAVASTIRSEDLSAIRKLLMLTADSSAPVRLRALFYVSWLPDSVVDSLQGTTVWPAARLLLSGTTRHEIESAIRSESLFDRRIAIASALRNYGDDADFLQDILPLVDDEVAKRLSIFPRNRTLRPLQE